MQVPQNAGEQINTVIDHLADKLSVPAGQVWQILLLQAKVEFWQSLIAAVVAILVTFAYVRYALPRIVRAWQKLDNMAIGVGGLLGGVFLALFDILIGVQFYTAIGYFINPQYYALHSILGR